jgi:hypothetical protein
MVFYEPFLTLALLHIMGEEIRCDAIVEELPDGAIKYSAMRPSVDDRASETSA